MKLILTCEHGGNDIPKEYNHYFENHQDVLNTHHGFDLGALDLFNALKPLATYTKYSKTSRLLIELNRSVHHKNLFSEYSKELSKSEKTHLIQEYYSDYRNGVEEAIKNTISTNQTVLHISVHSFTPILNGIERKCDIGLLYDPSRYEEKDVCSKIKKEIVIRDSELKVRYNYPYLGVADGFTGYLRKQFSKNYIGIEIEVNQKFVETNNLHEALKFTVFEAIKKCISLYSFRKIN